MSKPREVRMRKCTSGAKGDWAPSMTLADKIADELRERIIDGTFQAGEHLHQAALAKQMGISSIPFREAIRMLESEGFVEMAPFKGARVKRVTREELAERVEIASALEGHAMELTQPTLTAEDFDLAADLAGRIFPTRDVQTWYVTMRQLLSILYGADRWPLLFELIARNRVTARRYMELLVRRSITDRVWADKWAAPYFPRLIESLRRGDLEGAKALQRQRMVETMQYCIALLEQGTGQENRRREKLPSLKGSEPSLAKKSRAPRHTTA